VGRGRRRGKREEGRGKREEGRGKERKREEGKVGRGKREEEQRGKEILTHIQVEGGVALALMIDFKEGLVENLQSIWQGETEGRQGSQVLFDEDLVLFLSNKGFFK
jgi:hypothetical protein